MTKPVQLGDQTQWQSQNLEHLRYEYSLSAQDMVLDIGAYQCEFATGIYNRYQCKVLAFEPTPQPADALLKWEQEEIMPLLKTAVINETGLLVKAAAWIKDGIIQLGGEHFWVGMYEKDHLQSYPCLDIIKATQPLKEIALCKINIEGGEYKLLPYMIAGGMMDRVKYLQVQFHLIEGQDNEAKYATIAAQLEKTHKLSWRYPFVWESWERK
jgi:FkbM family methyltransferase